MLEAIAGILPAEYEQAYDRQLEESPVVFRLTLSRCRQTLGITNRVPNVFARPTA